MNDNGPNSLENMTSSVSNENKNKTNVDSDLPKKHVKKSKMERKANRTKTKPNYTFNEVGNLSSEHLESISNILGNMNPLEIFEEFLTPEFYEYLKNETERYPKEWENKPKFSVTIDELKSFIGFLIFSGYHTLTSNVITGQRTETL
ncbi:hypothetical protein TNCV_2713321 [Trichonephila clavipes]|nr:hypothetical protein TNCV_2713321 [Trichonephila clavipes]